MNQMYNNINLNLYNNQYKIIPINNSFNNNKMIIRRKVRFQIFIKVVINPNYNKILQETHRRKNLL